MPLLLQRAGRRLSSILLAVTVCLPALAFTSTGASMEFGPSWGRFSWQRFSFGEPKLALFQLLVGMLWLSLLLHLPWRLQPGASRALRSTPAAWWLSVFLLYAAISRFWVWVPENHTYELQQYFLLYGLLVSLCLWALTDPQVVVVLRWSLALGLTPVVAIGLVQWSGGFSGLPSIDPGYGVGHASTFGYKNPMALAVLLHIFLLVKECHLATCGGRRWRCALLWPILGLHLVYLATLQSRTSYLAFLCGCGLLLIVSFHRARRTVQVTRFRASTFGITSGIALSGIALFTALLLSHQSSRLRLASLVEDLHPSKVLETDRGVYLRNTLSMVEEHPWGVGLGDWQTHYPLHRKAQPELAFDSRVQVRRPHNDHVQILGELGWPGLMLWGGLLVSMLWAVGRGMTGNNHLLDLYHGTQLGVIILAMAGDFVIEQPWHKQHLFLLSAYFLLARAREPPKPRRPASPSTPASPPRLWLLATLLPLAFLALRGGYETWVYDAVTQRIALHHDLVVRTLPESRDLSLPSSVSAASLAAARAEQLSLLNRLEGDLKQRHGHQKTSYRAWLALAQGAAAAGDTRRAEELAYRTLRLHPTQPATLQLLSRLSDP